MGQSFGEGVDETIGILRGFDCIRERALALNSPVIHQGDSWKRCRSVAGLVQPYVQPGFSGAAVT